METPNHCGSAAAFRLEDCKYFDKYSHGEPYCGYYGAYVQFCADVDGWECPMYTIFGMTRKEYDRECRRMSNEINDPVL